MCTAAVYTTKDTYFGRTLDNDFSYGDEVVVTPRNYLFHFIGMGTMRSHYAMIGMSYVTDDYPLYYDAINEKGLGMAGLNFVGNAVYHEKEYGKDNIAQFELIPWVLGQCATVEEAEQLLGKLNLWNIRFHEKLPAAQLHWFISDGKRTITAEPLSEGIKMYENPTGVLTNNPPFDMQLFSLNNYMGISAGLPEHRFAPGLVFDNYCRGLGGIGLPGDLSSQSRFIRASFVKMNSVSGKGEKESVSQFFHILNSVEQQRGCCDLGGGKYEVTIYTSCCNTCKGIYYYTSYDNHQITAVDMHRENLDGSCLIRYPLMKEEQILFQNAYDAG